MAKPNVLVDGVSSIVVPPELKEARPLDTSRSQLASVNFQGGGTGFLDMAVPQSTVWGEVLESLRETSQPAYVEIDPKTSIITELLCPVIMAVVAIGKSGKKDDVEIELAISHARHFLRRSNPNFEEMLKTFQIARKQKTMVMVTESSDGHEIIDVRLIEGSDAGGLK